MKARTMKLPAIIRPALAFSAAAFAHAPAETHSASLVQSATAIPRVSRPVLRVPLQAKEVSAKFEVAAAGTYADLKAAIDVYKSIIGASISTAIPAKVDWMDDAMQRVDALASDAETDDVAIPSEQVIEIARNALVVCGSVGATEPSLANDDEGGIEIYVKSGTAGLLVSIQPSDSLTIFGDDQTEHWRGKYQASGSVWKSHLSRLVGDMLAA